MVENLFINGCSFLEIYNEDACRTTAGHHLAEKLNLNPIGYANAGRGNDRIVATTKLFFYENPEFIKNTFALIGWSHVVRFDYLKKRSILKTPTNESDINRLVRDKNLDWGTAKYTQLVRGGAGLDVNKSMRLRHLGQVLSLQDFFKLNNIKYCMYNALTNKYNSEYICKKSRKSTETKSQSPSIRPESYRAVGLETLAEKIDKRRFFEFDGESHLAFVQKSIVPFGLGKGKALTLSTIDDHPNRRGHMIWGNKLYSFIKENNLL